MTTLERYKVPAEPFRLLVAKYLHETGMDITVLSERVGMEKSSLGYILQKREEIRFDLADSIMCGTYGPLLWHCPPFAELYWQGDVPPDPLKPVRCAHETCDKWFEADTEAGASKRMSRRRYCSEGCQNKAAVWRRGESKPRHRMCRNGHDRAKAGVYMFKKGGKTYQRCRQCHLAGRKRSYLKNEVPRRAAL